MVKDWWTEAFRWIITTLIFGTYTAIVFYTIDENYEFLLSFDYYFNTISTTSLAFFLRYLWADKGLLVQLNKNPDIKEQENGKGKLIAKVNENSLADQLETAIDITNAKNKKVAYRSKCERKIRYYQTKGILKPFRLKRLEYWTKELEYVDSEEFNVDTVKVKYYEYDINSMLTSTYKTTNQTEIRGNLNNEVFKSYRTNFITIVSLAVIQGIQLFQKDVSYQDTIMLFGKFIVFLININSGLGIGRSFVDNTYSRDLTKDYSFLTKFLKEKGVK